MIAWPHLQYPKMPTSSEATALPVGTWVATEKVHGANLCLSSDGDRLRGAKRKAFLSDDDDFFGWQRVAEAHHDGIVALAREAGDVVHVFGELCGGSYPHPDVPAAPVDCVQPGIHYGPDLLFVVFDVASVRDGNVRWWSFEELERAAERHGLRTVPVLARGDWPTVDAVDRERVSAVPALLGLPALDPPSQAEGVVIRSLRGSRVLVKRKAARFAEIAALPRPASADPVGLVTWELMRRVTEARLQAAVSKVGPAELQSVLQEAVADVWGEVQRGPSGAALQTLSARRQQTLWDALTSAFRELSA